MHVLVVLSVCTVLCDAVECDDVLLELSCNQDCDYFLLLYLMRAVTFKTCAQQDNLFWEKQRESLKRSTWTTDVKSCTQVNLR